MASPEAEYEDAVIRLGAELFDGVTSHEDHDRKLRRIQSKYSVEPLNFDLERKASFNFDFPDPLEEDRYTLEYERKGSTARGDEIGFSYDLMPSNQPPVTTISVTKLRAAISKVEDFIKEWTPFLLVASYFIFSTCLYMICSGKMISIFWFIYLTTNFYIAGSTVVEAIMSISPCRDGRRALRKVEENQWIFPTPEQYLPILDLVTVAYLPNEKDIILDRIQYAIDEIVYPKDRIRINIVYNTPKAYPEVETQMLQLASKHQHLRIIKVPGSKSKADNLN